MDTIEAILARNDVKKEPGRVGDLRYLHFHYDGDDQWVPIVDIYQETIITVRCHADDQEIDLRFWIKGWDFGDDYVDLDTDVQLGDAARVSLFYSKKICDDFQEKYHWEVRLRELFENFGEDRATLEQLRLAGLVLGVTLEKDLVSEESPVSPFYQKFQTELAQTSICHPQRLWLATGDVSP